ncbi:hypothetical protein RB628_25105 [Streptomyces sp. ADMS]|uniref:hypothetical protein n=1 Tax=Streptomyces sp. ADMS TaxID=3071415 RepID=UPI00296F0ED8|nr:hypothetical protein [Streptomyces sp. ADMS]MDW4908526.1 hypothetical protein [Streptomyces sp. ADMS]
MKQSGVTHVFGVTHVWVPFRDTFLYVAFPDGDDGTPGRQALLAGALSRGDVTRDARYGEPLWRVDARDLHTVVEALWSTGRPVRIHLDQVPRGPHGRLTHDG